MTATDPQAAPVRGQVDGQVVPRYAGPATFARLPRRDEVDHCDVAVLGVPFDSGVSYRPGARFGPSAVREASRLLRPYHPGLDVSPFNEQQVADAGDVACNPFDIMQAIGQVERAADEILSGADRIVAIGGDHTIALPMLRAISRRVGPVALVHFDAHIDTWDTYFGAAYMHGTPFRRASEEGLIIKGRSAHVGARSSLYARADLTDDEELGFTLISAMDIQGRDLAEVAGRIRDRTGDSSPVYISVDIDVLDPACAPGTGTPEAGGLISRELLGILRALRGLPIVGADVVEVAPAYDHAEITAVAASHVIYELVSLFATEAAGREGMGS